MHKLLAHLPAHVFALGFSLRKRPLLRRFVGAVRVSFVGRAELVPDGSTVLVWASGPFGLAAPAPGVRERCATIFVEDGFLRSVGLGADLVRPSSWVLDSRGMYFDASQPSDLEQLLQTTVFSQAMLERSRALRATLVSADLTKYNVGATPWARPASVGEREVILAVGQVESDAAIRLGTPGISTNIALLRAARAAHPHAWLIYKPHPDVVAGLRGAGAGEGLAAQICDEIVTDTPIGSLLGAVDVVHVLTSLAGFEALLRGTRVVCHGLPFYAGWGLTQDSVRAPRRSRELALDQLVAGVLLEYPVYLSWENGQPCEAETAVAELRALRDSAGATLPTWRRALRPLLRRA